ncbi:MAG: TetR/AcrR family transcriptional regulator [Peptostreptococcaceae bacterium]|nr:TetR/AcrR family transcriptional regulator [Peptostreptococcaceae bacterium]MDY5739615.1 TetR/AcrR family transcriptional regulator [Anaerovoracaceae bacterium]SFE14321.1 transcriptional regulator, TetR family [Peptostreptococcaceae bacterium pGA-8]
MGKKNTRNTKGKIISAAWKLFYEQGYDDTTVDEIVEESATSKGSFYHYFEGKDALLSSLSYIFDEKYDQIRDSIPAGSAIEKLCYINQQLFLMIENSISVDLLARLFSSQLITRGNRHLLDQDRTYYKLLREILQEGQSDGQLRDDISVNEVIKAYALMERGMMYDWCLCNGDYSLAQYSRILLPQFLDSYKKQGENSN